MFIIRFEENLIDRYLCKENLQSGSLEKFGKIEDEFLTIAVKVDQARNVIIVTGLTDPDNKGRVEKYDLLSGKLLKAFVFTDVTSVSEVLIIGKYCLLGCDEFVLKVLDLDSDQVLYDSIPIADKTVFTLELCKVVDSETAKTQFVLALGGDSPDYSDAKTDLFDVTALVAASQSHRQQLSALSLVSQKNLQIRALKQQIAQAKREHQKELSAMASLLGDLPKLKVGVLPF